MVAFCVHPGHWLAVVYPWGQTPLLVVARGEVVAKVGEVAMGGADEVGSADALPQSSQGLPLLYPSAI